MSKIARRDYVSQTLQRSEQYYCDSSGGNDANNGRSWATAKKTLPAVFELLPDVITKATTVNLAGTFSLDGYSSFQINRMQIHGARKDLTTPNSLDSPQLLIDGGVNNLTIISGPHTSESGLSDTFSIGTSGAGWTADALCGYHVEITNGPDVGHRRLIIKNTSEQISVSKAFSTNPGTGTSYRIVKPATTISHSSASRLSCYNNWSGWFILQNLYFDKVDLYTYTGGGALMALEACVFDIDVSKRVRFWSNAHWPQDSLIDPLTLAYDTTKPLGFSIRGGALDALYCQEVGLSNFYAPAVSISNSGITHFRAIGVTGPVTFKNCNFYYQSDADVGYSNNTYQTILRNTSGVGLTLDGCENVKLKDLSTNADRFSISNCASHAIEATRSYVHLEKIQGTGNSGAGLYAHSGSQVTIKDGSPPTLTGTVGDITVLDPTLADVVWSDIDSAGFSSAREQTCIKGVA